MSGEQGSTTLEQMTPGYHNICENGPASAVETYADAMRKIIEDARPSERSSEDESSGKSA